MSRRDQHRPRDFRRSPDDRLRERVLQAFARKWELDNIAKEVLRGVFAQCEFREGLDGKFSFRLPSKISLNQQTQIAAPLRESTREYRERVIGQLERIANVGRRIGLMVRGSLANPLVFLAGKSPFDGYLTVCRNSGMHWGIVRALQHLRDVMTVTEERYFTDPRKINISWRLHVDRITPTMLQQVEKCLRAVDAKAFGAPACNPWLNGIRPLFEQIKEGTFQLPTRPGTAHRPGAAAFPAVGESGTPAVPSVTVPSAAAEPDEVQGGTKEMRDALRGLRQYLLPQYLDLSLEDFTALCRCDWGAGDFARRLGGAVERFSVRCLEVAQSRKVLDACVTRTSEDVPPADDTLVLGKCLWTLTDEASSLRDWLESQLPQEENTLGRRLLTLVESSVVSGLFCLFLRKRFAELFQEAGDQRGGGPQQRSKAEPLLASRLAALGKIEAALREHRLFLAGHIKSGATLPIALDVAKYCEVALAALPPLILLAARDDTQKAAQGAQTIGKLRHRFLSAEGISNASTEGLPDYIELVEYEPGAFPPLRCHYWERAKTPGAACEAAQVCRFSRKGGVTPSPHIAIPVAALFGEESRLARAADFLRAEADRHLAQWPRLAKSSAVRQCLPYLENRGGQLARIEIRGRESGDDVVLLAVPTAATAMSDDFAENIAVPQAIDRAVRESPAREVVLRAVEAYWHEKGIAASDYSLGTLVQPESARQQDKPATEDELQRRRKVRRFLSQKARWPLEEAEEILNALDIVIEPKSAGAPHGKVRLGQRHHTLSSKLLKDGQVYATYLHEWISTLGQERLLGELLERKDPRLVPYMRRTDDGEH